MRGFSPCDQANKGTLIRPPATFSREEKDGFRDSPASRRRIAKSPMIPSPPGRRCREAADEGLFTLRSGQQGNPHPAYGHLLPEGEGRTSRFPGFAPKDCKVPHDPFSSREKVPRSGG